jgi:hypothetical protein
MVWLVEHGKDVLIASVIAGLLALGLIMTLWSGVVSLGTREGLRCLGGNLSQVLLRLLGFLAGLLAVQRVVGFRLDLGW